MREALRDAMAEEMRRDEGVFVMGEDVGVFQGAFKVTEGLLDEFGERRVRDTPISENTIVGAGVGAAMGGLRPMVELMTVNFSLLALDQIVNHAAAIPYMFNGQARVPMVIRMPGGGGHQLGPTHSHSFEALYLQVPGLLVACPSTPADGKALLKAAIRDDNPVIFIEHESLYGVRGEVPDGEDEVLRFGEAAVRREGADVTIVGVLKMAQVAEQAAAKLADEHGVEAEVIDPRTLRPLDLDTILESVRKTNRAVIVEEGWPHGGVGANLATLITEQAFDDLDAPVQRVTGADVHMPYSKRLEQAAIPHEEHVVQAALADSGGVALMAEIVMPRLSDSMEEGTILAWMKQVGDEIAVGDEIVEIETDKANMAYESDVAGTLTEILAEEGETLPIGTSDCAGWGLGRGFRRLSCGSCRGRHPPRCSADKPPPRRGGPPPPRHPQVRGLKARGTTARQRAPEAQVDDGAERVKASPVARRIAKEKGVDLSAIQGSGPGGRIVKKDVKKAVASPAGDAVAGVPRGAEVAEQPSTVGDAAAAGPAAEGARPSAVSPETAKGAVTYEDLSKLQSTIARRMSESKATAPHFYLEAEIDMSRAVEARARIKASGRRGRGGALVQRHGRQGLRAGAARAPAGQRRLPRRALRALLAGQRRGRGRRPGRARRPHRLRRRQQGPAADRHRVAGAGAEGARRPDHPAGALRRHLHRLQPGDVRDRQLQRRDQHPAGGDPRGRRDQGAPGRPRRRDRPPPT